MTKKLDLKPETLADIMQHYSNPEQFADFFTGLKKAVIERALEGELDVHLGYRKGTKSAGNNVCNGLSSKIIHTDSGTLAIETPRDRDSSFEPQIVKKGQRRLTGCDDKIISMYGRGMSMREIQEHLMEIYGTDVSPELISSVTDKVIDEVVTWQNRPLDNIYPILYLDAIVVKVKENNQIINKSIYVAVGVNMEGYKEVLGLWIAKSEGSVHLIV